MGVTNLFDIGPVVINSTTLKGVTSHGVSPEVEQILASAAGEAVPSFVATIGVKPVVTFQTTELATLLGAVNPLTGLCFPTGTCVVYFTRKTKCAPRSSSSDHLTVTIASGLVVINRITCPKTGGPASAEVTIYAAYDGSNPVLAYATNAAAVSNVNIQELFTMGPQKLNGSGIPDVQNVTIDFSPTVSQVMGSEDTAPTMLTIDSMVPRITLDTLDPTYLNTYGTTGTSQSASATNFYFAKLSKGALRVADGTAQHIKFSLSASQGQIHIASTNANQFGNAGCQLMVTPIAGSSAILTYSAASAIT